MVKSRATGSAVPLGLWLGAGNPGVETPGYCQMSLWDEGMAPAGGKDGHAGRKWKPIPAPSGAESL
jgi:hypothetical protein